uniref:Uncharacterized protein n=1 Tax=Cacopsylla melanoneura TaxID=428564 RepID=A0A8D9B3I9_9HEMI
MPEFNLTLNTDTENQPDNVSGSMESADDCRIEPNRIKQCKVKKTNLKKAKPKTNLKKRQISPARPKKKLTKRNAKTGKKLNKRGDKCCQRSDFVNRKVSFILDEALRDPCESVLDCDPCCDYPDRKKKSGYPHKSRSSKPPKKSLNKGDPNEMNLLLDLLESAQKRRKDETGTNYESMEDCRDNKIQNLRRWFLCNLKERFGCSECPNPCCRQPCIPCCSPMCPMTPNMTTCGDQPTNNIWDDLIQNCQKQFCKPKKACCGIMCPGCCCPCQGNVKRSSLFLIGDLYCTHYHRFQL